MEKYDSRQDTIEHIKAVKDNLNNFGTVLRYRGLNHDRSKLESPEKEIFDKMTPVLKTLEYGSQEYKDNLERLKPALEHHYKNNSHHPEFFSNGIDGMNLADVVEMFCDWKAAVARTKDGDIRKSLEINRVRFKMSDQLYRIFVNSIDDGL